MILVTTNPEKYREFAGELAEAGIELRVPPQPIPEFQAPTLVEVAHQKALAAARALGEPVLVDDTGLLLDAYPGFPGPYTSHALRTLGREGLRALTAASRRGRMVSVIAWSDGVETRAWAGESEGELDLDRPLPTRGPGPLVSWFVSPGGPFEHRRRALAALLDAMRAGLEMGSRPST